MIFLSTNFDGGETGGDTTFNLAGEEVEDSDRQLRKKLDRDAAERKQDDEQQSLFSRRLSIDLSQLTLKPSELRYEPSQTTDPRAQEIAEREHILLTDPSDSKSVYNWQRLGEAIGSRPQFFRSEGTLKENPGFVQPEQPGLIFLNAESEVPLGWILAHEAIHVAQKESPPAAYDALQADLEGLLSAEELAELKSEIADYGYNPEQVEREWVPYLSGEALHPIDEISSGRFSRAIEIAERLKAFFDSSAPFKPSALRDEDDGLFSRQRPTAELTSQAADLQERIDGYTQQIERDRAAGKRSDPDVLGARADLRAQWADLMLELEEQMPGSTFLSKPIKDASDLETWQAPSQDELDGQQTLFSRRRLSIDLSQLTLKPSELRYEPSRTTDPRVREIAEREQILLTDPSDSRSAPGWDRLGQALGSRPQFFRSKGELEENPGFVQPEQPGLIFVNAASDVPLGWTLAHEAIHVAQKESPPAAYESLKSDLENLLSPKEVAALKADIADYGYSSEQVESEWIPYLAGEFLHPIGEINIETLDRASEIAQRLKAFFDTSAPFTPSVFKEENDALFSRAREAEQSPTLSGLSAREVQQDIEAATLQKPGAFSHIGKTMFNWLKGFRGAAPRIPVTGDKARKFARYVEYIRLAKSSNEAIRKEASEDVDRILDPLRKLGRKELNPDAIQRMRDLVKRRAKLRAQNTPQAKIDPINKRIDAVEAQLKDNPFYLFQTAVLYRDLWWRSMLLNDDSSPVTLPGGLTQEQVRPGWARSMRKLPSIRTARPYKPRWRVTTSWCRSCKTKCRAFGTASRTAKPERAVFLNLIP